MKRIFGIGLSRTGTTSLTHALRHVGIDMIHYPTKQQLFDPQIQAVSDIPVALYYKELDKKFPNSLFIYTTRDRNDWIVSMEKHLIKYKIPTNKWFKENRIKAYGGIKFNKNKYLEAFDKHDNDVREYFKNRADFKILYICNGDGWNELLPFIGITNNGALGEFPHKRKTI